MPLTIRLATSLLVLLATASCTQPAQAPGSEKAEPRGETADASATRQSPVERGRYLVTLGGCHDCHTPKKFGPQGPEPDMSLALSGSPAADKLPAIPTGVIGPDKWGTVASNHFAAWVGPWGVSFSRNLTPDQTTGIGSWTEEMFIKTLRDGKHQGEGRPLLPPMPWQMYRQATDEDLKAIYAYLRSLPAIVNAVPDPIPPEKLPK
jgi:mono/diheme cytochrome c family protein